MNCLSSTEARTALNSLRRVPALYSRLTDEIERDQPQFLCNVWINRPLLDAVATFEQVSVIGHGVGLLAVSKIVPASVGELGRDGCNEGGSGTLLDRLVDKDSCSLGLVQVLFLSLCEVSLQPGSDAARVDCVGDDAIGGPATCGFDRESSAPFALARSDQHMTERTKKSGYHSYWNMVYCMQVENSPLVDI